MFQSLANYLLGSVTTGQENGATAEGVENSSIRLTSVEQEDEWVLVDRHSDGNSDTSSVASLEDADCNELESYIPLPAILTRASSTSSLPYTSNMEESWFVTPPPCFTSTGPIRMATSPLENLLIEHPSMSVYQHTLASRRLVEMAMPIRPASASSDGSFEGELEAEDVEVVEVEVGDQVAAQYRAPRLSRSQVLQQQERQRLKSKRAQKAQMQKACLAIKRECLDRTNKAREVNSRNRRQRRGERSQGATRSYANNNRKC